MKFASSLLTEINHHTKVVCLGMSLTISAVYGYEHPVAPVPKYIKETAQRYGTNATALYTLALVNSKQLVRDYIVTWPWTVYPKGQAVKLKDQITLINYISHLPNTPFGLYGLTLDDFRKNRLSDDLFFVTSPKNQVNLVVRHFDASKNRWLISAAKNFGLKVEQSKAKPFTPKVAKNLTTLIAQSAKKHGVSPSLIAAVIRAESAFNAKAVSHAGARGLMQVMPSTARSLGVNPKELFVPAVAIDTGTRYLAMQLREFGDLRLALAAYNAGPGAVKKYGRKIPPYKETQDYVEKVSRFLRHYQKMGRA